MFGARQEVVHQIRIDYARLLWQARSLGEGKL